MYKKISYLLPILIVFMSMIACSNQSKSEEKIEEEIKNHMTEVERSSIVIGEVSEEQKYYDEVANVAEYIQEISVYDEELDSNYIIHITLPPDYDEKKTYPMFMMTDGIWRLSDHAELRPMMVDEEIESIILVSIGYDYGIDAEKEYIRKRELVTDDELFLNFITDNLSPYLGEIYSIDYKRSALSGHSLGGLFMHNAIFNSDKYKNQPFHYYLIGSPAFWYVSEDEYLDTEEQYFTRNTLLNKEIYVTAGSIEDDVILTHTEKFMDRMEQYQIQSIEYEIYPGLNHVQVFKPTLRETLLRFYSISN